jgi:hypothetical protein
MNESTEITQNLSKKKCPKPKTPTKQKIRKHSIIEDNRSQNSSRFSPLILPRKIQPKSTKEVVKKKKPAQDETETKSKSNLIEEARILYKLKNYNEVKRICILILKNDRENLNALFLFATSCMFLDKFEKAIKVG